MFEAAVQLRQHLLIFEATVLLRQYLLITEATFNNNMNYNSNARTFDGSVGN